MAVAHVQFASQREDSSTGSVTVTLGSAPTAGNVLLFLAAGLDDEIDTFVEPPGFTKLDPTYNSCGGKVASNGEISVGFQVFYRVVQSGDGTSHTASFDGNTRCFGAMVEVSGAGTPVVRSAPFSASTGVFFSGQDATVESTSYAFMAAYTDYQGASWTVTTPTDFTGLLDSANSTQGLWCGYDIGATTIADLAVSSGGANLCGMLVEVPESGTTLTPWDGANFVTVKPSGGSYTTFNAAIADFDARNGVYQAQWDSNTACTTQAYVNALSDSSKYKKYPNEKRYLHITGAPGFRHSGVPGTGHARFDTGSANAIAFGTYADWTRISHLELTSTNDTVLHSANNNILLDNLIFNNNGSSSRGISLAGNSTMWISVYNCVFQGFTSYKDCFYPRNGSAPITLWVAHCSIDGRFANNATGNSAVTYNNWWRPITVYPYGYPPFDDGGRTTQGWIRGGGNVHDSAWTADIADPAWTDYTRDTRRLGSSWTTTTTSTDAIIVTNTTSGSENLTPLAPTGGGDNPILGAGVSTDEIARYDTRVDLSLDIAGNPRPTTNVDIGAFQISEGGDVPTGTPIKVWTGSAWVNVNSLSVYDGGWS